MLHRYWLTKYFDSGATLYKGINRGLGTLLAISFAFLVEIFARHFGHSGRAICIGFSVFLIGMYNEFQFYIHVILFYFWNFGLRRCGSEFLSWKIHHTLSNTLDFIFLTQWDKSSKKVILLLMFLSVHISSSSANGYRNYLCRLPILQERIAICKYWG